MYIIADAFLFILFRNYGVPIKENPSQKNH
jgi:hypothetical protein